MSTQSTRLSDLLTSHRLRLGTGIAGFALTLLSAAVSAQSLPPSWTQSWLAPTTLGGSYPIATAATPDAGFIQLNVGYESASDTHPVGVVHYNANGQLRWSSFAANFNADFRIHPAIAVGSNGSASIVFRNKLSFSQSELVIRSYNLSSGQLRWEKRVPELDSFNTSKYAVQMQANNEIAVLRQEQGDVTLTRVSDIGTQLADIRVLTPGRDDLSEHSAVAPATGGIAFAFVTEIQNGESVVHLVKYGANGILEFDRTDSGGTNPCVRFPASLRLDGSGNLLLGRGTLASVVNNIGTLGYRLQKRSASGQLIWTRNEVDFPANDFAVNANGEIALVRTDFDQINVAKISANGIALWTRQYHGDQGYATSTDAALSIGATGDVRITSFNKQDWPGNDVAHVVEWRNQGALCTETLLQTGAMPLVYPQQFIEQNEAWAVTGMHQNNPSAPSTASIFRFPNARACTSEKFMDESFEAVEQPAPAPDFAAH